MWLVSQIFLCIISFVVTVNCQGGGGGGGGGGGNFAFGFLAFLFLPCICCWYCFAGRPRRSNTKFVTKATTNNIEAQIIDIKLFQSGLWESQYWQHKKWHGPYQVQLSFDAGQLKVTGSGSDDVGTYSIDGVYSTQTRRIGLKKTYQYGTGNPLENLGHDVTIQLEWDRMTNQFEGKWFIRTKKYFGSDKFTLRSKEHQSLSSIYEKE